MHLTGLDSGFAEVWGSFWRLVDQWIIADYTCCFWCSANGVKVPRQSAPCFFCFFLNLFLDLMPCCLAIAYFVVFVNQSWR